MTATSPPVRPETLHIEKTRCGARAALRGLATHGWHDARVPLRRVHLRLLPWRPRWRTGRPSRWDSGVPDLGGGDDPVSAILVFVLLVLLLPVIVVVVVGVVVLGVELSLLLLLLPLAWAAQLVGLQPWRLVLTAPDGTRTWEEVRGTLAMLRRRRQLRGLVT